MLSFYFVITANFAAYGKITLTKYRNVEWITFGSGGSWHYSSYLHASVPHFFYLSISCDTSSVIIPFFALQVTRAIPRYNPQTPGQTSVTLLTWRSAMAQAPIKSVLMKH